MNAALTRLWEELKATSGKAKLAAGLVLVVIIAIVSVASIYAVKPHYKLLYSELTDRDSASAQRALAEAGIDYRISQPPGPYFLYVSEAQEFEALRAVASSGALERPSRGIMSAEGVTSVFVSSGERAQIVQKRYWQEAEQMLESFEFVVKADVRTNTPADSPFANAKPRSGSVSLKLVPGTALSRQQKSNVANIVSFYLDVPTNRLVITDQGGDALWSPDAQSTNGEAGSLLEHAEHYNQNMAQRVMELLDAAYGEGRSRVRVVTEWDHDRRTRISKSPSEGVLRESEVTKSETPQGASRIGGVPGTASNIPSGDSATASAASPAVAKTGDTRELYDNGVATEHVLEVGPRLKRLHVSLLVENALEEELGAEHFAEMINVVKASVGFSEERGDHFEIGQAPFESLKPELDEEGNPIKPEVIEDSSPSAMLRLLLERGVEIVAALAFIFVLLRTLKSDKPTPEQAANTPEAIAETKRTQAEASIDPEKLLLYQVDDLVKNDPERVGKILSRWAREDTAKV